MASAEAPTSPDVSSLSQSTYGTKVLHSHQHGAHFHEHEHTIAGGEHEHGWHSPAESCKGDDTFGLEVGAQPANLEPFRLARVYVAFVPPRLHPQVVPAVLAQSDPDDVVLVDVSGSQYNYHALVARLWRAAVEGGRDFTLVEQDVGIPDGALAHFEECPELLCVHDYAVFGGLIGDTFGRPGAFGCTRFRAELCARFPDLLEELDDRHWSHLDGRVLNYLRSAGVEPHEHRPPATHFHDYQGVEPPPGWYDLRPWAKMPGTYDVEAAFAAVSRLSREGPLKIPDDVARYDRLLSIVGRPSLVVETGLAFGGSMRYFSERADFVLTIEIDAGLVAASKPYPPNVAIFHGDSSDPSAVELASNLAALARPGPIVVSLDSDHHAGNVRAELDLYADLVTPGSYLVVEDTFRHFVADGGEEGDPWPAVRDFLAAHRDFEIDDELEKLTPLTLNPGGWMRRK